MTEVYLMRVNKLSDGCFQKMISPVGDSKRESLLRYKAVEKRDESLTAEILMRAVLCHRMNTDNKMLEFCVSDKGKPYLKSGNIFFNVSHTKGFVAVAVSEFNIGIDIELVKDIDPKFCGRFCSEGEQAYIISNGQLNKTRFFEVWTRKEAIVKQSGAGLSMDIASIDTLNHSNIYTSGYENCVFSVCCEDAEICVHNPDISDKLFSDFLKNC